MNEAKRRWPRWLLELAIALLVLLLLQAWMTRDAPRGPAPEITGVLLDGTPVRLADLRGKPALVHFWATWCPICGLGQDTIDALRGPTWLCGSPSRRTAPVDCSYPCQQAGREPMRPSSRRFVGPVRFRSGRAYRSGPQTSCAACTTEPRRACAPRTGQ